MDNYYNSHTDSNQYGNQDGNEQPAYNWLEEPDDYPNYSLIEAKHVLPQIPPNKYCNGRLRHQRLRYCCRLAGQGTKHPGVGRCVKHSASSGSKVGNKSAVMTHEHETFDPENLYRAATEYHKKLRTTGLNASPVERCKDSLRDTCLRLFLMHERLKCLMEYEDSCQDGLGLAEEVHKTDVAGNTTVEFKRKPIADLILATNECITRQQAVQTRQIDTLLKALQAEGDKSSESTGLELLDAIHQSIEKYKTDAVMAKVKEETAAELQNIPGDDEDAGTE